MSDQIVQTMLDGISPLEQEDCYVGIPLEVAVSLERRALRIQGIVHSAVLEVGRELVEAKQEIAPYKSGGFEGWVEKKTNITRAYAYQLMDTYEKFGVYNNIIHTQFSSTSMLTLSLPNVPQSARDEAVQRAESGEEITVKLAKEIAEAHKARREAEEKTAAAQQQLNLFTQLSHEKIDDLSQQIIDLEEALRKAVTPEKVEVIPQTTLDKIANLEELVRKQKERIDLLSGHSEKLAAELLAQTDANEARHKREQYETGIRNEWKKTTDTICKAITTFVGQIPPPIDIQVFEAREWAKYDQTEQAVRNCQEALTRMRITRYGDLFVESESFHQELTVYEQAQTIDAL